MKANPGKTPLKAVADVPMPGPAVRFDYQSLDTSSGRLYIAHMNADQMVVFDTSTRKVIANLSGFSRVHGVWAAPEIDRVFASVTGEHKVAAVDAKTLQTVAKVGPINYPDGVAYAPSQKRVFVSDEHGGADVVIDAETNTLLKKIDLGGGAGNTVYDPGSGRLLVAVHEKNELVTIDPDKLEIVGRLPLPGIKDPHGVSVDTANRLAFVAGEGNHKLALVDLSNMKILGTYPVGEDPDVLSFEPDYCCRPQRKCAQKSGDAVGVLFSPVPFTRKISQKCRVYRVFQLKRRRDPRQLRLAGGGRSHVRTLLRRNSLLTGKNTGNFANFACCIKAPFHVSR
jgi:hypothetical protein